LFLCSFFVPFLLSIIEACIICSTTVHSTYILYKVYNKGGKKLWQVAFTFMPNFELQLYILGVSDQDNHHTQVESNLLIKYLNIFLASSAHAVLFCSAQQEQELLCSALYTTHHHPNFA